MDIHSTAAPQNRNQKQQVVKIALSARLLFGIAWKPVWGKCWQYVDEIMKMHNGKPPEKTKWLFATSFAIRSKHYFHLVLCGEALHDIAGYYGNWILCWGKFCAYIARQQKSLSFN